MHTLRGHTSTYSLSDKQDGKNFYSTRGEVHDCNVSYNNVKTPRLISQEAVTFLIIRFVGGFDIAGVT